MPAKFELIAPCFFGCESTANFELRRIGAEDIRVSDGRLTFKGGADMIAAANLNLRTVERVMLLLNTYPATTFDELFDGVYSIPWEELLPADAAFPVSGSSLNSQLSSVPACQSIIKKAVVKRLMQFHHTSVLPETGAEYKIRFMLRKNVCEIMLDTTGEGLHKRGYRRNAMEAPIRETLAATIADLGRVRRDSLVEDPFCGSGTLLIEAAQKAMNIAPGLKRRFAAERYGFVPAAVWAEQRQKALADSKLDAGFEAFGYDIDPAAVALANANAKLAGVEKRCHFEVADVADFAAKQRGKGYLYWGDSPWCVRVESEDAARCTLFSADRMVTDSKAKLLESLTDDEKAMVRRVFLTRPLPEKADGATLLLPRSFVADGLMTQAEQDAMFKAVAEKYAVGPLFIKTHPRDTTDYHALFPDAVILERTMPSEVLNFCLPFKFARAVTVQSFVLRAFTAADEKILLSLEEAQALLN